MPCFSQTIIIRYMVNFAFLDSGTGGLPYLKYLKEKSPLSKCIYVGDTKNFPYGEKTSEQIIKDSCECVQNILDIWNPNVVVVACNTISVTALDEMRKRFPKTPFVGTVPAIKPAAAVTKSKKIGLLATDATVNHPYTKKLIEEFAESCSVFSRGDPKLVSFIEHEYFFSSNEQRLKAVTPAVDYFKSKGCDVIVLACTHFLNMADYIQTVAGSEIKVIDSREGVVRHALEVEKSFFKEQTGKGLDFQTEVSNLFVTGFKKKNDSECYKSFCKNNGIVFGGLIPLV